MPKKIIVTGEKVEQPNQPCYELQVVFEHSGANGIQVKSLMFDEDMLDLQYSEQYLFDVYEAIQQIKELNTWSLIDSENLYEFVRNFIPYDRFNSDYDDRDPIIKSVSLFYYNEHGEKFYASVTEDN